MTKEKFLGKREEIALSLGSLILGWYDYAVRFEKKGEQAPQKDYLRFKMAYDMVISQYVKLWNKTAGEFVPEGEQYDASR